MPDQAAFHTGKEQGRRDAPPFRAYFTWLRNGQIVRAADSSVAELREEIARRGSNGDPTTIYEEAIHVLERSNLMNP